MKISMRKTLPIRTAVIFAAVLIIETGAAVYAKDSTFAIAGCVYEFEKDSHYEVDEAVSSTASSSENAIGRLNISGNITSEETLDDVPAYTIGDGVITLSYTFDQSALNMDESDWCITDDKTKKGSRPAARFQHSQRSSHSADFPGR